MERRRYVVDTLVAACAFAFSVAVARHGTSDPDAHDADVLAYVLLAVYSGSVAIRGKFPVWAVAVGFASGFAYAAASYPPALTPVVLLSVYTAATRLPWTASRRLLVIAVIVSALGATLGPGPTDVSAPVLVAATWLLGHYVRTRRLYTDELERKNRELEQAQHDLARRAVVEERLRIARELHDVVAHALSVIAVQAGAGRMVGEDSPSTAREALASIETASRSALGEMRRLLMVLRSDEGEVEPLVPSPGLSELEGLVATTVRSDSGGPTMPTLIPTAATGARSKPEEMTYVDPARTMMPEEDEAFLANTGLNGPFVADLLSDMLAHERCGAQLYRSVADRTNNPVLKQRYTHFGKETTEHIETLEGLIAGLGGDPGYISPAARATEKAGIGLLESTFLLAGSVDLMTQELVMLDAVLLAEAKDHANWSCLAGMVDDLPAGDVCDAFQAAVDEVEVQEDEHLRWAQDMRCRVISLQATSGPTSSLALKAEEMLARIKGLFD